VQHGDGQSGTDHPAHAERHYPDPLGARHVHAHAVAALQEPLWGELDKDFKIRAGFGLCGLLRICFERRNRDRSLKEVTKFNI
jgi:hypothetical protein